MKVHKTKNRGDPTRVVEADGKKKMEMESNLYKPKPCCEGILYGPPSHCYTYAETNLKSKAK